MKSRRGIWHNGEIKPESEAKFSIYTEAAMRGYVFEMTRSFNLVTFKLEEHLERLFRSAKYIGLKVPYTLDQLVVACTELIRVNEFDEGVEHRLIINFYGGALSIYGDVEGIEKGPQVMIADIPMNWTTKGMDKLYETGINAIIPNQKVIPSYILDNRVKHHNRLHFARANMEISDLPGIHNWPLLTDDHNYIAEFPGANVFIVKNDVILTPFSLNILEGISRKYVMGQLSGLIFMECVEKNLLPYDILNATEAFCTATPFCILPVTKINGQNIGDGKPGKVTMRLLNRWSANVGVDIVQQIKDWNKDTVIDANFVSPYVTKKED